MMTLRSSDQMNAYERTARNWAHLAAHAGAMSKGPSANTIVSTIIVLNTLRDVERIELTDLEASLCRRYTNYEIIIVDNLVTAESAACRKELLSLHKNVRWISLLKRQHRAKALSVGLRTSIGDYTLTLTPAQISRIEDFADDAEVLTKAHKRALSIDLPASAREPATPVRVFPRSALNMIVRATSRGTSMAKVIRELDTLKYSVSSGQLVESQRLGAFSIANFACSIGDILSHVTSKRTVCEFEEHDSLRFRNPGIVEFAVSSKVA